MLRKADAEQEGWRTKAVQGKSNDTVRVEAAREEEEEKEQEEEE